MVDGPAPAGGFHWRYAFVALCFAILAATRLDADSTLWAAVFGLAALIYAYLSVRYVLPPSLGGVRLEEAGQPDPASAPSEPPPEALHRALKAYESRTRGWLATAVAGWIVTAVVILLTPPLALVAAALSLFATNRFRRCRRSVEILRRALAVVPDEAAKGTEGRSTG